MTTSEMSAGSANEAAEAGAGAEETVAGVLTPPSEPGVFSFGVSEIMYLCDAAGNEASRRTLEALRIDTDLFVEPVRVAAISSLVARGYLKPTGPEGLEPAYAGAAIVFAAGNAARWVTLSFLDKERSDNAFLLQGGGLTILFQRRLFGVHHAMVVDEGAPLVETIWGLVDAQFEIAPDSTVGLIIERIDTDESQVMFIRQAADDAGVAQARLFDVALGKGTDEKPDMLEGGPRDEAALDELLEQVLGPEPETPAFPAAS